MIFFTTGRIVGPSPMFFKLLNPVNYWNSPRSGEKITGLIYWNSAPKAPGSKNTGFRREAAIFFKNYMIFTGFQQKLQEFYRNLRKITEINYWINAAERGEKNTGIPETFKKHWTIPDPILYRLAEALRSARQTA